MMQYVNHTNTLLEPIDIYRKSQPQLKNTHSFQAHGKNLQKLNK